MSERGYEVSREVYKRLMRGQTLFLIINLILWLTVAFASLGYLFWSFLGGRV